MHRLIMTLREQREQGFTLIELLVVVLIIGILAAVAIPMFMNQRKAAVESTIQSDLKNAVTVVVGSMDNKGYPDALPPDVKSSESVELSYYSNQKSYCLKGRSRDMNASWYYDSVLDGLTQKSCSANLDAKADQKYGTSVGHSVIYPGSATWTTEPEMLGPSGESVQKLDRVIGSDAGWGAYGTYHVTNGTIPAGTKITISVYAKSVGAGTQTIWEITNDPATNTAVPRTYTSVGPSWQRLNLTTTLQNDWVPGVQRLRFGFGTWSMNTLYLSDLQVSIAD